MAKAIFGHPDGGFAAWPVTADHEQALQIRVWELESLVVRLAEANEALTAAVMATRSSEDERDAHTF